MGIAAQCLHGAGLCVIPKPANDHRPLALRHGSLSFLSALLIAAKVVAFGITIITPSSAELSTITTARIVQLTNAERKKAGLNELAVSSLLANAAAQKGQHMLSEDYFAHISPSGVTPWFWMNKVGYTYQVAGENLAIDFVEAEDVVAAWLASPTHKENMLHPDYTQTGIGVVTGEFQGGTSTIVVHMFGLPAGGTTPNPAATTPSPAVKAVTTQSPSPSPAATPTPTPVPPAPAITPAPPADTSPPRVPRIALAGPTTIQDSTQLSITGDPETAVWVLVNNQSRGSITLSADGTADYELRLPDVADGQIIVRAYAQDPAGNQSELSEPLAFTKDTVGPQLAREAVSFVLAPGGQAQVLALIEHDAITRVSVLQAGDTLGFTPDQAIRLNSAAPFTLQLADDAGNTSQIENIALTPSYSIEANQQYLAPPSRFSQLARRLSISIAAALVVLLLLAIFVRIQIQKPFMIAHASLVLLLAAILFIV